MTDRIVIFYGSKKDFEELVATETSKEQVTIIRCKRNFECAASPDKAAERNVLLCFAGDGRAYGRTSLV